MRKRRKNFRVEGLASKFRGTHANVYAYVYNGKRTYDEVEICILLLDLIEYIEEVARKVDSCGPWLSAIAFLWYACDRVQEQGPSVNTIRAVICASHLVKLPEQFDQTAIDWTKSTRRY